MNSSFHTSYKLIVAVIALLAVQVSYAQEEESTIGTEVVNVVKAYTVSYTHLTLPTIYSV